MEVGESEGCSGGGWPKEMGNRDVWTETKQFPQGKQSPDH